MLLLAPGWLTPSPPIPEGISPARTRCSAVPYGPPHKGYKNVTLSIKAGAHTAIWWPSQPQSEMQLPYSVYSTAGGLQKPVDQISPPPSPRLFLVSKPFPNIIELKENAGLLFFLEGRRRMKVFRNQFRWVWIQLNRGLLPARAVRNFQISVLSPMLLSSHRCE